MTDIRWNQIAVIDVDTTEDFMNKKKGSLYVNSSEKISSSINKIKQDVKEKNWKILKTIELHPPWHISFASSFKDKKPITESFKRNETPSNINFISKDEIKNWTEKNNDLSDNATFTVKQLKEFIEIQENQIFALWPDHCVENTKGSETYNEIDESLNDIIIKKGYTPNSHPYSAFEGKTLDEEKTTLEVLKEFWIKLVKIVGVATDYCVIATAMDAKKYWFEVELIKESTAWVDPSATIEALNKMRENWIKIIE